MGVEWYGCGWCSDTFPDCGSYFSCNCGAHFCDSKCAAGKCGDEDDECGNPDERTCRFCRKEEAPDYEVLQSLMKHFKLTKEQVLDIHFNREALIKDKNG